MKKALVVGASGLVGGGLVEHFATLEGWSIVGVSRRGLPLPSGDPTLAIDLLDASDCREKLRAHPDITHVFYAAYSRGANRLEEVQPNRDMLVNIVSAASELCPALERVVLTTGTKYYGIHLGKIRTPARETDPRQLPPNFYYDQADALEALQKGQGWTFTHLIPPFVTGFAIGNPMNLVVAIGAYAGLSKRLGLPLRFPGSHSAYQALFHIADSSQIAVAAHWASESSAAENGTFNIANGDPTRWPSIWAAVADHFDMELADPFTVPLAEFMPANQSVWEKAASETGLASPSLTDLVNWSWADYMLRIDYDVLVSMTRIRQAGFRNYPDTETLLLSRLKEFQHDKIIF